LRTTAKLLMLLLFCVSILFLATRSHASSPAKPQVQMPAKQEASKDTWAYYASDEEGTDYSYDPSTIKRLKNDLVRVWVHALYSEKHPKYSEGKTLWEIDCTKKTLRGLTTNTKKKDGTSTSIEEPSDWSAIPAESTAETLYGAVCNKKDAKRP
jgi:hypothetical protein